MKVSHRELVDIAAKFNPQAALDIPNNTANALVLADDARRKQSVSEMSKMVDSFMAKGILNEATTYRGVITPWPIIVSAAPAAPVAAMSIPHAVCSFLPPCVPSGSLFRSCRV